VFFRVYGAGPMMYTLTATLDAAATDAEPLIKAALESFKFTTAETPVK
jgi:hypothetical protein